MRTIGLLGGMTSESSAEYYKLINTFTREKLGGNHSAKSVMVSVDFGEMELLMESGEWEKLKDELTKTARQIEAGGADFLVICTNTIHKFADHIESSLSIPVLNIIDVTAKKINENGFKTIGLLGTRFTMEEEFYKGRLLKKHGINSVIPTEEERKTIHKIIMEELSIGVITDSSRKKHLEIINNLSEKGAEGVILGCTEIPSLVSVNDIDVPLFDTTLIHAKAAVNFALG